MYPLGKLVDNFIKPSLNIPINVTKPYQHSYILTMMKKREDYASIYLIDACNEMYSASKMLCSEFRLGKHNYESTLSHNSSIKVDRYSAFPADDTSIKEFQSWFITIKTSQSLDVMSGPISKHLWQLGASEYIVYAFVMDPIYSGMPVMRSLSVRQYIYVYFFFTLYE